MNLTRGWLAGLKPLGFRPACLSLALVTFSPHAVWAALEAPPRADAEAEADALPRGAQTAAHDLQLSKDAGAKADALASFSEAIIAEDNADSDQALAEYEKALTLDPGYTELAVKVAFEFASRGDASSGIQVLKDAIKAAPNSALPYLYLSQLYSKYLHKADLGLKYATQALALDPNNLAAYLAVYELYQSTNQTKKAAQTLEQAEKGQSKEAAYWLQLGDFLTKTAPQKDGVPAPEELPKISDTYRKALALSGEDVAALAKIGDFYRTTHQEKEAIPLYLKALKFTPASAEQGDQTQIAIRDGLAKCFQAVGKDDEAISTLQDLVQANPLRYETYDLLTDLYTKKGDYEAALGTCQQMMLLDPSVPNNYLRMAGLQVRQKKYDVAVRTLNDARLKFPAEAQVTYTLGLVLSEAKRYKEALQIFDEAMTEASTGQTEMLDSQFYLAYGVAAEEAGMVDKAVEMIKKSIALDPANAADAYNYLGYMWVDRGERLEEAGDLIKRAVSMKPDNAAFIDSLGWYYFKKGDLKQALDSLKKAVAVIQPEDAVVDEHLGDVYAADNDPGKALTYWQKAEALDKGNKGIATKIEGAKQKLAHLPVISASAR